MTSTIKKTRIADITITDRIRKDMGDLQSLANSMAEGVLQPIGITPDRVLVFGERRLLAARDILGWKTIPARIVDVQSVLHGQFAENLMRKEYTVSERVAIVEAMRSHQCGGDRRSDQFRNRETESLTVDELAKKLGLGGKDGFARAKKVIDNGVPELVEAMDSGKTSLSAAAILSKAKPDEQLECLSRGLHEKQWTAGGVQRALQRVRSDKEHREAVAKSVREADSDGAIRIYHCRFQGLEEMAGLKPESVQLICTDIPYCGEFVSQLDDLAALAKRLLIPGGLFVSYLGQHRLDEKLAILSGHLKYQWVATSAWSGGSNPIRPLKMASTSIPIAIYSQGKWTPKKRWNDTLLNAQGENGWHPWQRPLREVEKLVGYFSERGDLVVDPCGGGFTTAAACDNLGRRFVGCDIDKAAAVKGQERLAEKQNVLPFNKAKPIRINTIVEGDCRGVDCPSG